VRACDLAVQPFTPALLDGVALVAVHLPMHTATRLALPVIAAIVRDRPGLPICAYGLYAPLNRERLHAAGVSAVLGPEAEQDLVAVAAGAAAGRASPPSPPGLGRPAFRTPDRSGLPPLDAYARLQRADGTQAMVGSVEATRGCKHRCRHCPIVPVYDGRFRAVPADVVLADVAAQVDAGAGHISFGDPDFFNGPTHARRLVEALHARWPRLSYDVTIKVTHLRDHDVLLPVLRDTGCAFVTTAVESFDDAVLARLDKGHTRADVIAVAERCQALGLPLAPTFVAFTPWTTAASYWSFLDDIDRLGWISHVAPIQYALRLLVTWGSRLLELDDVRERVGAFDHASLTYPWRHRDPAVDALQHDVMTLVGRQPAAPRDDVHAAVRRLAARAADQPSPPQRPRVARAAIPYLTEPWYC
jgi:hypothetical protein